MRAIRIDVQQALVALQVVALSSLAMAAILRFIRFAETGTGPWEAVVWVVLIPLVALVWHVRPRFNAEGRGALVTAISVLLATPVAVFGTLGFTIPVLLLIVAFAVVDVSPKAGVHALVWISGVGFLLHLLNGTGSWEAAGQAALRGLVNVVPTAVLLCFGLVLGLALKGYAERQDADRRVIARLRHASDMEKELLLSDERARSAREVHDGLGHRLTLVSMSLELAERLRGTDPDQSWQEIRTAKETSSEALSEMRTWVRALNPVRDESARGLEALELIAESFRGTGLAVEVRGDAESDLVLSQDERTALLVFRTVQEGLTNALRHSRARLVRIDVAAEASAPIRLENSDRGIRLTVSNDFGPGASTAAPGEPAFGFGLRSLDERAAEVGGRMQAFRTEDEFRLEISLPCERPGVERAVSP